MFGLRNQISLKSVGSRTMPLSPPTRSVRAITRPNFNQYLSYLWITGVGNCLKGVSDERR
ncbi:hypothetical protein BTN49_1340 [Candidatus Enterovibrio escicola]|uniref:Uncharacterized protein n=2 Tax=Candidatus Enterovibrio escicola TaxID=1927127 RepID=A0A2A5T4C0_9GAMM|nr:hypothetical protein BTN49_1340 [Candidatus Enterovibrio escacola]